MCTVLACPPVPPPKDPKEGPCVSISLSPLSISKMGQVLTVLTGVSNCPNPKNMDVETSWDRSSGSVFHSISCSGCSMSMLKHPNTQPSGRGRCWAGVQLLIWPPRESTSGRFASSRTDERRHIGRPSGACRAGWRTWRRQARRVWNHVEPTAVVS